MRAFALTLTLLAGVTSSAAANTTLSTGLVQVNPAGTEFLCQVTNIGTTPVTTVSTSMFDNLSLLPATADNCGEILPAHSCFFSRSSTLLIGGQIVVRGSAKKLRGRCIARVGSVPVDTDDMR